MPLYAAEKSAKRSHLSQQVLCLPHSTLGDEPSDAKTLRWQLFDSMSGRGLRPDRLGSHAIRQLLVVGLRFTRGRVLS